MQCYKGFNKTEIDITDLYQIVKQKIFYSNKFSYSKNQSSNYLQQTYNERQYQQEGVQIKRNTSIQNRLYVLNENVYDLLFTDANK